ncbi:MAG: hypothetical protein V1652_00850 [bacterium]
MTYRCEQCLSISDQEELCPMCGVPMRERVGVSAKKEEAKNQDDLVTAEETTATNGTKEETEVDVETDELKKSE